MHLVADSLVSQSIFQLLGQIQLSIFSASSVISLYLNLYDWFHPKMSTFLRVLSFDGIKKWQRIYLRPIIIVFKHKRALSVKPLGIGVP